MGARFEIAFMDGTQDLKLLRRDPGNRHFEAPRSGISDGEKFK